jgi:multiple sugar transport system substrate-binding protein
VQYLADLSLKKGIMAPSAETGKLGARPLFVAGTGAIVIDGSWQISWYVNKAPFPVGFAPLPIGPKGRKSMFNGLADSVWAGSKHPAEAWAWAKFLGSQECQDIVGKHGVVFPAVVSSVSKVKEVYAQRKIDVAAFIDEAKPESTFAYPITDHASQVSTIMQSAFDNIFLGKSDAKSELARANREVNALFQ